MDNSVNLTDRMRNGLKDAWRYLTDWEAQPSSRSVIVLFGGGQYHFSDDELRWPPVFLQRFHDLILCPYRTRLEQSDEETEFAPSSDIGWGCMLRTCQSLLANALKTLRPDEDDDRKILELFLDHPDCPFSLQAISRAGYELHRKEVGSWFGPSTAGAALRHLVNRQELGLRVVLDSDQVIYEDEVEELARREGSWCPLLILVATRLGISRVSPIYLDRIKAFFKLRPSVGIAGGRPSSSYYFVGVQEDDLFYLDPHYAKTGVPFWVNGRRRTKDDWTDEEVESFHPSLVRKIKCSDLDPSMLIGYLCQTEEDWRELKRDFQRALESKEEVLFHIAAKRPTYAAQKDDVVSLSEADE